MVVLSLFLLLQQCLALRYDPAQVGYNLNENQNAIEPKDYWGTWENHTYNPSPENWRMPFYVLTIDRYIDGDPTNNEANNTVFEKFWMSNQFRFGGDTAGIMSDLDYVQGLGGKNSWKLGADFNMDLEVLETLAIRTNDLARTFVPLYSCGYSLSALSVEIGSLLKELTLF